MSFRSNPTMSIYFLFFLIFGFSFYYFTRPVGLHSLYISISISLTFSQRRDYQFDVLSPGYAYCFNFPTGLLPLRAQVSAVTGASSQGGVEANASILGLGGFFFILGGIFFSLGGMCVQCESKTVRLR